MKHIGDHPLSEMYQKGLEIDCQCARCGSSVDVQPCEECDDGYILDDGDCYVCDDCHGRGNHKFCMSSSEWCEANPLPGREHVKRGTLEWFTIIEPRP